MTCEQNKMYLFKLKLLRIVNNKKKAIFTTENQLLIITMTSVSMPELRTKYQLPDTTQPHQHKLEI